MGQNAHELSRQGQIGTVNRGGGDAEETMSPSHSGGVAWEVNDPYGDKPLSPSRSGSHSAKIDPNNGGGEWSRVGPSKWVPAEENAQEAPMRMSKMHQHKVMEPTLDFSS